MVDANVGRDDEGREPVALGVRWTQLPDAMQVMLVSEPPRLLINRSWWRRAAGDERLAAFDLLRGDIAPSESPLHLWGRRPRDAEGVLRQALGDVPKAFWVDLAHAP
jgi:hypothetical protein